MNEAWRKFKTAFVQNSIMMQEAGALDGVTPKNRKELRDLLRTDPTFNDVRKLVFGSWRR